MRPREYVATRDYLRARETRDVPVESQYLEGIRILNGVFKTTSAHRLDDANERLLHHLVSKRERAVRVLDVACSSGLSTVELHDLLRSAGFDCETHGTDLLTELDLFQDARGRGVLVDAAGKILQVDLAGTAVPWPPRPSDLLFRPVTVARATAYALATRSLLPTGSEVIRGGTVVRVPLTTRAVDGVPGLAIHRESILEPRIPGVFDVIRAANILNLRYFSQPELIRMARALFDRLAPEGLLLVIRSGPDGVNRGTLFRKTSARALAIVDRIHGGSEVESLVSTGPDLARDPQEPKSAHGA
jgi:hypothetical protein